MGTPLNTVTLNVFERAPLVLDSLLLKLSSAIGALPSDSLRRNRLNACRKNAVEAVSIGCLLVCVTFEVNVMVRLLVTLALMQRCLVCLWNVWATLPEFGAVGETIISLGLAVNCGLNVVTVTSLQRPCVFKGCLAASLGLR